MKIGKYTLHVVTSGYFKLDGGAMFGIIPRSLWEKTNMPDNENRIKLATRNLLLISESKKILIDTGMGNKWEEKAKNIYAIEQDEYSINSSLQKINFKVDDITDVILTHLHFDHTGGSTIYEGGKIFPAFSNAQYYVSKKNYDWATAPSDRDRGSYIKENFIPLKEAGVLNFFNDKFFDDEIELIEINGHTFGQNLIKISNGGETLLFCGDLFPTASHIPLPYIMGYDLQPLVTLEEKKKILPRAVNESWKLFFEHDPFYPVATVTQSEKGFIVDKKYENL
jgi:glyoxylase-like metal-dependent hydrolase (beta-lactamase superfamily II)